MKLQAFQFRRKRVQRSAILSRGQEAPLLVVISQNEQHRGVANHLGRFETQHKDAEPQAIIASVTALRDTGHL
jgi:hypothetical protein